LPPAATSCPGQTTGQVDLVLTFDDGPFPADRLFTRDDKSEDVLAPLNDILSVLNRRQARSVFFIAVHVAESVDNDVVVQRADIFAQGLRAIHESGHVLGYHAFNHDAGIWANPVLIPLLAEVQMAADLDRLQQFIDDSLAPTGLSREVLFAPVFRQPFGGDGFFAGEGLQTAERRGWAYHGYHIDSGDWTVNLNADPAVVGRLPVATPDAHQAFVRGRLRDGAAANQTQDEIDVLLHVNSFTASRLDEWIGILQDELGKQDRGRVVMGVPDCYLTQSDSYIDPAIILDVIAPSANVAQ
jgi:peptidoglycan/xylan/chitin deacetylase (PgdA/CDA1 family)